MTPSGPFLKDLKIIPWKTHLDPDLGKPRVVLESSGPFLKDPKIILGNGHPIVLYLGYTACHFKNFEKKKCAAKRHTPFESAWFGLSKKAKMKKIHGGLFVPSPIL